MNSLTFREFYKFSNPSIFHLPACLLTPPASLPTVRPTSSNIAKMVLNLRMLFVIVLDIDSVSCQSSSYICHRYAYICCHHYKFEWKSRQTQLLTGISHEPYQTVRKHAKYTRDNNLKWAKIQIKPCRTVNLCGWIMGNKD